MSEKTPTGKIVVGGLTEPEYEELEKKFPVHGFKEMKIGSLIRYLADRTGKTPGELIDMWQNNLQQFKQLLGSTLSSDLETARLVNLSMMRTNLYRTVRKKLSSNPPHFAILLRNKNLEPLREFDPRMYDDIPSMDDFLDNLRSMFLPNINVEERR